MSGKKKSKKNRNRRFIKTTSKKWMPFNALRLRWRKGKIVEVEEGPKKAYVVLLPPNELRMPIKIISSDGRTLKAKYVVKCDVKPEFIKRLESYKLTIRDLEVKWGKEISDKVYLDVQQHSYTELHNPEVVGSLEATVMDKMQYTFSRWYVRASDPYFTRWNSEDAERQKKIVPEEVNDATKVLRKYQKTLTNIVEDAKSIDSGTKEDIENKLVKVFATLTVSQNPEYRADFDFYQKVWENAYKLAFQRGFRAKGNLTDFISERDINKIKENVYLQAKSGGAQ